MKLEWHARWSGGMKEAAVLIRDEEVIPQSDFARHIRHIKGGCELYRADVKDGDVCLLLYQSGSGKTETATELTGNKRSWDCWDDAEQSLELEEKALDKAFYN